MKPLILLALVFYATISLSQPTMQWQKTYGSTSGIENFARIQQTKDGGYIAIGHSTSGGQDVVGYHDIGAGSDIWIVKTDAAGDISWAKCYGGTSFDQGMWIEQTTDNGYIFCGESRSSDGDVSGKHGSSIYTGDAWVVKIDNKGVIQWQKCLGGTLNDRGDCIRPTTDGGFIMAGFTSSNDGDITASKGNGDMWVVKLKANGDKDWEKCYGGTKLDQAVSILQANDGNYIVTGLTNSSDGDLTGNKGSSDGWVLKLNNTGSIMWDKHYGGSTSDQLYGIVELPSSAGFVIVGYSNSSDGDITANKGESDAWVLKIDANGSKIWSKTYGGTSSEILQQVVIGLNNSYIISGGTTSKNHDVSGAHGLTDGWLISVKPNGDLEWQKVIGGTNGDGIRGIAKTTDDGLIVAGSTASNDGDVTGSGIQTSNPADGWIVKLNAYAGVSDVPNDKNNIIVYPTFTTRDFHVKLPAMYNHVTLEMTDMYGRTLPVSHRLSADIITVSARNVPPGMYLLKINMGDEVHTARVIYQP